MEMIKKLKTGKLLTIFAAGAAALLLTGGVMRTDAVREKLQNTQAHMADEVLRFHILANSNETKDQNVKLAVKDAVIAYLKKEMGAEGSTLDGTRRFIKEHIPEIEKTAAETINRRGYEYPVKAGLEKTEFPEKTYGDVTFPAGRYEALRIEIGKAKGHNWWCVLYPNLCFIDTVRAVVPENGKQKLKHVLTDEEYDMVTASSRFKIKWFFFGDSR